MLDWSVPPLPPHAADVLVAAVAADASPSSFLISSQNLIGPYHSHETARTTSIHLIQCLVEAVVPPATIAWAAMASSACLPQDHLDVQAPPDLPVALLSMDYLESQCRPIALEDRRRRLAMLDLLQVLPWLLISPLQRLIWEG